MKSLILSLCVALLLGCAHCASPDLPPNIRTQPGIEDCGKMCDLFKTMDCKPYYEDIILDDGGTMTCTAFCVYELQNSVPLNPTCIVQTLKTCDEIEKICK